MEYKCSRCKLLVIVLPNTEIIKACKCDASIIADIKATATGNGGVFKG